MHIVLTLVIGLFSLWAFGIGVLCLLGWKRKSLLVTSRRIAIGHVLFLLFLALLLVDRSPCVSTPLLSTSEKVELKESLDVENDENISRFSFSGGELASGLRSAADWLRIEFHSEILFPMQDRFQWRFALGHPLGYLNGELDGSARIEGGKLSTTWDRLWIGRIPLVGYVRTLSQRFVCYVLDQEEVSRRVFASINYGEIRDQRVYFEVVRDREMIGQVSARLNSGEMLEDAVLAVSIVEAWVHSLPEPMLTGGDADLFVEGTRFMFREAKLRAPKRTAIRQNRAAILAASIWMGHARILLVSGRDLAPDARDRLAETGARVQVYGRNDLVRHFWVSAAITALASSRIGNLIGIGKEEIDSGEGGSGFSFADLLADRAGVQFAERALGSESQAVSMQERIAREWVVSDAIAPVDGLPEGIRQAELLEKYGGVDGPLYQRWSAMIDQRNASSKLIQKGR